MWGDKISLLEKIFFGKKREEKMKAALRAQELKVEFDKIPELSPEEEAAMKNAAKYDENGNYIIDDTKPYGSLENPVVVGMPDCSNSLFYDRQKKRWILTDGLGNGWIR